MPQLPRDMHLKNLLMLRFGWFEDALFDAAEGTEYQNITRAESRVLSHLQHLNGVSEEWQAPKNLFVDPQTCCRYPNNYF